MINNTRFSTPVSMGATKNAQNRCATIARFPQGCMRADRLSAIRQWSLGPEAALAFESPDYAGKAYFRLVNPDRADKGLTGWIDRVRLVESAQP